MKTIQQSIFQVTTLAATLLGAALVQADTIDVTAPISGNVTWSSTNEYVLNGIIHVLADAQLTIEPGTVIKGKPGQDANTSALIVTVGGKIFANGTEEAPIIFTAEEDDVTDPDDLAIFRRGLWGGVVLMGKSVLNTASDSAGNAASPKYDLFEGLADTEINGQRVNRFGGNDDDDNSGVMRYVSIRHAGVIFAPNKELNGLSFCAVGRGTTIEHVETYATADDGFEFFGGTVNTKWLVSAFNDDDCFDTDQGYRGKNQFWLAIQEPGKKDAGGEWNGEPNGLAANNAPIANYEIYNATFIGAGADSSGNRALTIREYAAPKVYNSIFTDFGGTGVRIDTKSEIHFNSGILDLRDNLWWAIKDGLAETTGTGVSPVAGLLFSEPARNNLNIDPMLRGISRTDDGNLDPRPFLDSPALTSTRMPPSDGFYTAVGYKGAFDDRNLWIAGWTFLSQKGFLAQPATETVDVTAPITGEVTWTADKEYVLNGIIHVLAGAQLTIEPGTVIKGKPGQDANTSALIVSVGGKIFANGTKARPIIFTAEEDDVTDPDDLAIFRRGLWGGVVLMGKSVLNTASDSAGNAASPKYDLFEGLADTEINGQRVNRFGGNDDDDNSGVMRYVSIRHAGVIFAPNKELNGLSFCAVGRGTTIEHVETYATADDGFEFFGGTVNTKWLVSAFNDDDCFDTDQGYRGKNQFWLAIQEPGKKDAGGEWNGEPNGLAANNAPIANYEIYNATFIGAGADSSGNRALTIREYAAPKVYNSIFTDFGGTGVRIDTKSEIHFNSGILDLRDNLWWAIKDGLAETTGTGVSPVAGLLFSEPARNNLNIDPMLRGISRTDDGNLDPRPRTGSPALTSARTAPDDGFYTPVTFQGAFNTGLWVSGWTFLDQKGILGNLAAGAAAPTAPALTVTRDATSMTITFPSALGVTYQVQALAAIGGTWMDEGAALPGTGNSLTYTVTTSGTGRFLRVVAR